MDYKKEDSKKQPMTAKTPLKQESKPKTAEKKFDSKSTKRK